MSIIGLSPVLAPGRHEVDQDDQDGVGDDLEDDSDGGPPPPRVA